MEVAPGYGSSTYVGWELCGQLYTQKSRFTCSVLQIVKEEVQIASAIIVRGIFHVSNAFDLSWGGRKGLLLSLLDLLVKCSKGRMSSSALKP